MNTRANTEFKFLLKYLLIGIACLGFALFSLYDGLVRFPARIPRAAAWEKLNADLPDDVQAEASGSKRIYAVHDADGVRLALVGDRSLAFALARQNDYAPVSVH